LSSTSPETFFGMPVSGFEVTSQSFAELFAVGLYL
jgi:hypothetical protein